jgi:hypothetical protein
MVLCLTIPDRFKFMFEHRTMGVMTADWIEWRRGQRLGEVFSNRLAILGLHIFGEGIDLGEQSLDFLVAAILLAIGEEAAALIQMEEHATDFVRCEFLTECAGA